MPEGCDRQPPWAPEAEISVLGGMLIDPDAVAKAMDVVDETMFYREAHRRIFRALTAIAQRSEMVDPVTLSEELKRSGELEGIGGMAYLAELLDAVPTAANIVYHARIVRDRALLRRVIEASSQAIRDAYDPGEREAGAILDEAQERLGRLDDCGRGGAGLVWAKHRLYATFEEIERRTQSPDGITGVHTGFAGIDAKTGGWQRGDLIVIAGRPSMGKTSLVTGCALHCAIALHRPVALFSLETPLDQLNMRFLSHEALVDLMAIMRGRLVDEDFVRLAQAAGHLNTAPIYVADSGTRTVMQIRAHARRLHQELGDLGMVVVDYLQLMEGTGEENRTQEVGAISRGLKLLALELNVPVVALSQLSRACEQRGDHRPVLADLRDSGAIEQDADVVGFLYRPERYLSAEEAEEMGLRGAAEFILAKQRNGPVGTVKLYFREHCARFETITHQPEPDAPPPPRPPRRGRNGADPRERYEREQGELV